MSDKNTDIFGLVKLDPRRSRDGEYVRAMNRNLDIIDANLGGGGGGSLITNVFYHDHVLGDDATADGSMVKPFKTVTAMHDAIGDAADNDEWNDPTKRYYVCKFAAGVVTEVVTNIPLRPYVYYECPATSFVGSWTRTFTQSLIEDGLGSPELVFQGASRRPGWDGSAQFPHTGIVGNLNIANNGQVHGSFFPQVHLMHFAIDGDILFTTPAGSGPNNQLFLEHAIITGKTDFPAGHIGTCNVQAEGGLGNEGAGDIAGIGGFTGKVQLFHLENVLISGDCSTVGGQSGCHWYNVRLLDAKTIDFSGNSSDVEMDAASMVEYLNGNDGLFTGTISFLDQAKGVGYTLDVGGDWDGAPAEVAAALDELAARLRILEP